MLLNMLGLLDVMCSQRGGLQANDEVQARKCPGAGIRTIQLPSIWGAYGRGHVACNAPLQGRLKALQRGNREVGVFVYPAGQRRQRADSQSAAGHVLA